MKEEEEEEDAWREDGRVGDGRWVHKGRRLEACGGGAARGRVCGRCPAPTGLHKYRG